MGCHCTTPASAEAIQQAAEHLAAGRLVAVPTETVYGLGADATNPQAVANIFRAKGRPSTNPLILHVASPEAASPWVRLTDSAGQPIPWLQQQWECTATFWPGPLTVVVPKSNAVADGVTAGADTVAIRVPNHPVMLSLLQTCPFPIAAPSANRSNYISPTRAEHVLAALADQVAMILDGGDCRCGLESTIIRLAAEGVELLRPGAIPIESLETVFGPVRVPMATDSTEGNVTAVMAAPGMMRKHYSPAKPMYPVGVSESLPVAIHRVGRIAFAPLADDQASRYAWIATLSEKGDLEEVARNLYGALRLADAADCDAILIDVCERTGIGRAIMDRIDRACAR